MVAPSFDPSALVPGPGDAPYRLTIEGFPPDHFPVDTWTGREALSEAYSFNVTATVTPDGDEDLEHQVLGRRASFVWKTAGGERAFYGVVAAVRLVRVHDTEARSIQVQVRFVPRLWLLKRHKQTRIFQDMKVPEVIAAVLETAGIGARFQLLREHAPREYLTQYEESDLAFVKRLCAESGIFFYFSAGAPLDAAAGEGEVLPGDTVVFADDASSYPPIGGDAPPPSAATGSAAPPGPTPKLFHLAMEETSTSHADKILDFSSRTVVKASRAVYRDYDPERPMGRPGGSAALAPSSSEGPLDEASGAPAGIPLEVYEHHGPHLFPKWSWAEGEAALILRQKRRRASTSAGESGCADLAPGHRFELGDHPAAHLNCGWVVTSVEHHGRARPGPAEREKKVYWNQFTSVPADVAFVPARPKRKPVQVALTATVVGPPGEEIHVDPMGQIKVEFHWDREGRFDDHSSCWIRVMQAWAGVGFGYPASTDPAGAADCAGVTVDGL
jgi:type VI secretion system secreted protein VgrG